ncbi:MAG: 30S ribosomal protein S4e, partial [Promethearchaeota archaeon]
FYRVLPSKAHGLVLSEITSTEAKFKLCRIENITTVKKGNLQLNLHDGRNIQIQVKDASKKPDVEYKTRGTLKLSIPDQKILDYYPMGENVQAIIYKGHNIGFAGKITKITERFGVNASIAEIGDISTAYNYAFIIGKDVPSIDLPME